MYKISKPILDTDGIFAFEKGKKGLTTLTVVCTLARIDYKFARRRFNEYFTRLVFDGVASKKILCMHFFGFVDADCLDGLDLAITSTGLLFLHGAFDDDASTQSTILKMASTMMEYDARRASVFLVDDYERQRSDGLPSSHLIADILSVPYESTAEADALIYEYLSDEYVANDKTGRALIADVTRRIADGKAQSVIDEAKEYKAKKFAYIDENT